MEKSSTAVFTHEVKLFGLDSSQWHRVTETFGFVHLPLGQSSLETVSNGAACLEPFELESAPRRHLLITPVSPALSSSAPLPKIWAERLCGTGAPGQPRSETGPG